LSPAAGPHSILTVQQPEQNRTNNEINNKKPNELLPFLALALELLFEMKY
jgi:hypothetical protein